MDAWEAYFWPNSNVLKNIPGFRTETELRKFEFAATRQRAEQLRENPVQGRFDTAHFLEIHRRLFVDVYEWAGQFRSVDMAKGGSHFAPVATKVHTLESWGEKILGELATENHLKGLTTGAFVDRLTYHYGEQNHWHPVREGNGRTTKEFLSQLAKAAGYELELDRISAKTWNDAAARQMQGDGRRVHEIFEKIAIPSRAVAFRDEHITDALKRFPELQGAANALEAAQVKAETSISPTDRRAFLYQVRATLLERLHAGEIINAPAVKTPPHEAQQTHEPYRR